MDRARERKEARREAIAARQDLFSASDFPPPAPGGKLKSCLYRVSEDQQGLALDRLHPAHSDIREAR